MSEIFVACFNAAPILGIAYAMLRTEIEPRKPR